MAPPQEPWPVQRVQSSTPHYQTFPTRPPTSRGKPTSHLDNGSDSSPDSRESVICIISPLPTQQLAVLAFIAFAEYTAFNSISPYLPAMTSTFPDAREDKVGLYVGLIAFSFAFAQFATTFFWCWLSDKIGRKPVILTGTILTAACFVAFGFCRTLGQAILVQMLMGLVNGNQGVVATCLGEITDRSNQSRAFTYLPVVYGIGGVTSPLIGGLLARNAHVSGYPYLPPNLVAAGILILDLVVAMLSLEESMAECKALPPLGKRVAVLFLRMWQFSSSTWPIYSDYRGPHDNQISVASRTTEQDNDQALVTAFESSSLFTFPALKTTNIKTTRFLTKDTLFILVTYFIFQFSNIAYNSLYPIFAQAQPPTGRSFAPGEIGISLAFAGLVTIIFQVGVFGKIRDKFGNKNTYKIGLAGFVVSFLLMPWVGYKDSTPKFFSLANVWLIIEVGVVLVIKNVSAMGVLTSAYLLITNSAPDHSVLGRLNGLAQTLSAAGRALGPLTAGSLFSFAINVHTKGEALAFGVFAGISFVGFLVSFGIRGVSLEADEEDDSGTDGEDDADGEEEGERITERMRLMNEGK